MTTPKSILKGAEKILELTEQVCGNDVEAGSLMLRVASLALEGMNAEDVANEIRQGLEANKRAKKIRQRIENIRQKRKAQ